MKENKTQRSKKWLFIILGMIVATAIIILLLFSCGNNKGGGDKVPVTNEPEATLTVDARSLLMKSGESKQLTASLKDAAFTSSNTSVAKVDNSGNVTAVAKGNALITITSGEKTAYCGVIVDSAGTMIDVSKQKAKVVFSDVLLEEPEAITSLAVDIANNAYYLAQPYATKSYEILPSDVVVSKVTKNKSAWETTEWMRFYESGTGTIAIEKDGIDTYLLLESNGTYYGSGNTLSSIGWENEGFAQEEYGETFTFAEVEGSASPAVDTLNNMLVIYDNVKKSYLFYDREALQSGENAVYLHEVVCANGQTPVAGTDDSQGFYNATIRDFAVADGYIYQICGSSSIYVSVFDMEGTLQYCYRVPDYAEDMEVRTPGGIACEGGKVYIAVGSGNSSYYFGNVWMFE